MTTNRIAAAINKAIERPIFPASARYRPGPSFVDEPGILHGFSNKSPPLHHEMHWDSRADLQERLRMNEAMLDSVVRENEELRRRLEAPPSASEETSGSSCTTEQVL